MEPIQSLGPNMNRQALPTQAAAGGSTSAAAAAGGVAAASSASSSTAISVTQQVETFLGGVNPQLAGNEYLKLLIAALILQYLLGDQSSMQQTGQGGLNLLEEVSGSRQNALYMSVESSTNTVQIEHQSSRLDVVGAVQSMSGGDEAGRQPGGEMDISG